MAIIVVDAGQQHDIGIESCQHCHHSLYLGIVATPDRLHQQAGATAGQFGIIGRQPQRFRRNWPDRQQQENQIGAQTGA